VSAKFKNLIGAAALILGATLMLGFAAARCGYPIEDGGELRDCHSVSTLLIAKVFTLVNR
jgi:hypothetical protein